jgi:hypothetical protein
VSCDEGVDASRSTKPVTARYVGKLVRYVQMFVIYMNLFGSETDAPKAPRATPAK